MKKRILGLDTGTNSLGWAVVDRDEQGNCELIDKGSLIFQEGVKIEKGIESSKAAERTQHRASRKHYFRRRLRKIEILKVLVKYGWCPNLSDEDLQLWHTKKQYPMHEEFLSWQRTNDNTNQNPYYFRHVCLHEVLDLQCESDCYVLGRALYHLAQRRGFMSNRLEQGDDKESGAVKSAISDLSKEIDKAGQEYLGDYFFQLYSKEGNKIRIRTRYTDREEHYKKEFYAICAKQQLTAKQIEELEKALYFQRPLKSQRQGVGKCTFEKGKPRCADSHPDFEMFRMLSFVNNIKVKGPFDIELRSLSEDELQKIDHLFYRKSKPNFDFEEIAKAIAGKNNYQYIKDAGDKPYKFNYRMSQGVPACPTIAQFKNIFGDDYANAIAEQYTGKHATQEEAVHAVWNVLYSFADDSHIVSWAKDKLQMDEETAEKFSKIRLTHSFASLSLCALRKMLPWLQKGLVYSNAVFMANIPDIIGKENWTNYQENVTRELLNFISNFDPKDQSMQGTLDFCIKDILKNMFELPAGAAEKLYHPSMIETYADATKNSQGIYQLGSPRTNAVRNPMAMRSLHEVRKVINQLLREGKINQNTEVHIEYARELNDANKRAAIARWNRDREKKRKEYCENIKTLYKEQTGKDIEPTDDEIKKYELWEEQNHICLYTGEQIGLTDFIGANPRYDIEHTIPRSAGGDTTMENITLCSSRFNRDIKKTQLPSSLANHEEILARLEGWKEQIEKLRKDADRIRTHSGMDKGQKDALIQKRHLLRIELDYLQNKYKRFQMEEVPEGFALRQGVGIGLVGKYAGLYLKSLFHKADDRNKSNVRVIKGATTAEYRKMWGLQEDFEKKSRDNHVHHCIDAITIACIEVGEYQATAQYYQQLEEYERSRQNKPTFRKPWPTFTEDVKSIAQEILVVHDTKDNMPKKARKYVLTSKGKKLAKGDCTRGSLHNDTYYGAIERDGEIRYVVRKALSSFSSEKDLDNIVDETVKAKVKEAVSKLGFKAAMASEIFMNEEKGIKIKKVRCYANSVKQPLNIRQQRDLSKKEYKQQFHVTADGNYCMAIYEGIVNGKMKRSFEVVDMLQASTYYKESTNLSQQNSIVPEYKNGLKLRCKVCAGTQILLLQNDDERLDEHNTKSLAKRLYYVAMMLKDGRLVLRYHQDARDATTLSNETTSGSFNESDSYRPQIRISLGDFHALVEGVDFEINVLGEIKFLNRC